MLLLSIESIIKDIKTFCSFKKSLRLCDYTARLFKNVIHEIEILTSRNVAANFDDFMIKKF